MATRRYGMIQPPPPEIAANTSPSFKQLGWLVTKPREQKTPTATPGQKSDARPYAFSEHADEQWQFHRIQPVALKVPRRPFWHFAITGGQYMVSMLPMPLRSLSPFVESSGFQPFSRSMRITVDTTEMERVPGPAATARQFANTDLGLWFKSWVVGPGRIQPFNAQQTPRPAFKGVLPNPTWYTMPQIIGSDDNG